MKNNKVFKIIALFCGLVSLSGCNKDTETQYVFKDEILAPVEINNIYDGMVAMYQTKNYTYSISKIEGSTTTQFAPLKFRENFIGFDGEELADFNGVINDGTGLFSVVYEDDYIISEYLQDDQGAKATSLWDNSVVHTMYGVGGQFIKKYVTPQTNSLAITDKAYIISFLKTLGFDSTSFTKVDVLRVNFVNGNVMFTLSINLAKTTIYNVKLINVGTTSSEHLKTFLGEGNSVFTPNENLQEMRRLIKLDNFIHQTYSIDGGRGSYIGYEFMTPHYFMTTGNSDTNAGAVYMEVEHQADTLIESDMSGIYLIAITNTGAGYEWSYSPNPINTTPEIEKCMHYPSALTLLNNLQYVKKGRLRGTEYALDEKDNISWYYVTEEAIVNDFAKNFSLTEQFADCTPLAVSIELDLQHATDKEKNIVFHCLMKYAGDGNTYDIILPLMWFGAANKPLCEQIYELLNNKVVSEN